ncbi:mycothiol system anti-sigma-R factor [Flaviflexus huanghaiensis]|uniref:mycothiol system anti-sigma-R factor n=1 Tax=Flaviflexus huanghaiensis TaxID=1111473 RepID=UPI0015FADB5D|nr:mycothiol system anti-sigma-R factor [Flaviflexus huanghaiensis]
MKSIDDVARELGAEIAPCTCAEVRNHLFELLDREMEDAEMGRLRAHAESCPECTEATQAEQHMRQIIRRSCHEPAPDSLRVRVVTHLTRH